MKNYRAYVLLNENKWKYYDLTFKKQMDLIIHDVGVPRDNIEEKITESFPKKNITELNSTSVYDRYDDIELPQTMWGTPSIKNKDNCTARMYWYFDLITGDQTRWGSMKTMIADVEPDDILLTAEFIPKLIKENTREAMFYQQIFNLIQEDKLSTRNIASQVSNENFKISHQQVNEMRKLSCFQFKDV